MEHFDAGRWADLFVEAGAKYAVLTARHSMGFALWNTSVDDRSIVKMSPYGKDLVAAWCEALRERGLKVGLYFCHRDWGDEDFRKEMGPGAKHIDEAERAAAWDRYLRRRDEKITELLSNYGKIDLLWLDEDWGRTSEQLRAEELATLIDRLQPGIVVNNRFGHKYLGHYGTPEQWVPTRLGGFGGPWEMCDTMVESPHWQHVEGVRKYKQKEDVLRFFVDVVTAGGNYLVNIGPRPDGTIPEQEVETLRHLGRFVRPNAAAIHGTEAGVDRRLFGGGSTLREVNEEATLYLFATDRPRPPRHELAVRGAGEPRAGGDAGGHGARAGMAVQRRSPGARPPGLHLDRRLAGLGGRGPGGVCGEV